MSEPAVLYESRGHVGVLTLNRPENRNSMTPELLDAFDEAVERALADREVRAVVITGRGNCFSAGADLKATLQHGAEGALPHERSYGMYQAFLKVRDIEVPTIGALNGHAVGGGFGLALCCDIRVASAGAKYGANFARLGLHSGMGVSYLLPRLVGVSRAAELLFTGRLMRGGEGAAMGLFSEALEADAVLPRAMELAEEISRSAPIAVREMKRSIYAGLDWDVAGAAYKEAFAQAATLETADAEEGMAALLEKREPEFRGR